MAQNSTPEQRELQQPSNKRESYGVSSKFPNTCPRQCCLPLNVYHRSTPNPVMVVFVIGIKADPHILTIVPGSHIIGWGSTECLLLKQKPVSGRARAL